MTAQGKNRAQASLERAQNLNPMVKVHADSDRIEEKPDGFFLEFEAVSKKSFSTLLRYLVQPLDVALSQCRSWRLISVDGLQNQNICNGDICIKN